jgi:hypothetical protein
MLVLVFAKLTQINEKNDFLEVSLLLTMCQPSCFGTSFADMAKVIGDLSQVIIL